MSAPSAPSAHRRRPRAAPTPEPSSTPVDPPAPFVPFAAPLVRGRFVRRYKRFFVDVVLDDGRAATAHTANTGAMTGLLVPGAPVLLTNHDNGKRALPLELEAIDVGDGWIACNTIRANRVAEAFLRAGVIDGLTTALGPVRREVAVGDGTRIDFGLGDTLVEVKSVTLRGADNAGRRRGLFPDAVSARGQRHLEVLSAAARAAPAGRVGAGLLFVVQRPDVDEVAAAAHVDPVYARLLSVAARDGVRLRAARAVVDDVRGGVGFGGALPVRA